MSRRRIAVVGSGIAGLTAGYVLSRTDDVTLFEADGRLGGHAHTHQVGAGADAELMLDSGFIVHNRRTYPLLSRLFGELGVTVQQSEMSMSVSCAGCGLEYAGHRGPGGLLPGLGKGGRRYAWMLAEVLRFHRAARRLLAAVDGISDLAGDELTLGQFLRAGGYSRYFTAHFALPFVAAVWSCPPQAALSYPARYLFTFLDHHGLLSVAGSPPWLTVTGGSRLYVDRVSKQLASVRAAAAVMAVRRLPGAAQVSYAGPDGRAREETFAAVIIATHPDQALRLLADPTPAEAAVLPAFRYSASEAVVHTDVSVLPASPRVRSSWNYSLRSCAAEHRQVQVSYYLNRLQRLQASQDYVVTLNPEREPAPGRVLARMTYEHPVYDRAALAAQRRLPELNAGVTAYAGAYHGWGFHEDGCRAGLTAAQSLGGRW